MIKTLAAACAAGLGLVLFATSGVAAPSPTAPPDGARIKTSLPVFRWTLPAGELAAGIFLARLPVTEPNGSFPEQNVVVTDSLAQTATRWTPSRPLWAGSYWWNVASTVAPEHDASTRYSAVSSFTIPISLEVLRLSGPSGRVVTVRWRGNVPRASITLRMSSRGRLVWTATKVAATTAPSRIVSTRFTVPQRLAGVLEGATFSVGISARVAPER